MAKCEATTHPRFWWNENDIDFPDCKRNASVQIDGINLCLQHAGTIAVVKLIAKGEAERLSTANPNGPLCSLHNDRWSSKVKS